MFKKIFAKLKFSLALFEKIPSFLCLVFQIENNQLYQAVTFRINDYL